MANEALRLLGGGTGVESEASDQIDLRSLWRAVMRRKWLLALTVVIVTGATLIYAKRATPLYEAEALINIQTRDSQVIDVEGVVEELIADAATIESEIQLLRSRDFLGKVVERAGLMDDPEFNAALRPDEGPSLLSYLNPLSYVPDTWLQALSPEPISTSTGIDPEQRQRDRVASALAGRVQATQVGSSYVVALTVLSENPVKAAELANAIAQAYLAEQVELKYAALTRATDWLQERIEQLRGEVLEAEAKIVEYRSQNQLSGTGQTDPLVMQIGQLNTQLALSQAQRAEAEARLQQVQSILRTSGVSAAANVLDSPLMASLRAQETELLRRLSELSSEFGENHPQMINTRGEIRSIRDKMNDEAQRIEQDLEDEVAVAEARAQELHRSLASLQNDASAQEFASIELTSLTREAETNRELFQTFLMRFREVVEQQELQEADARILSTAKIPDVPSYPRTKMLVFAAFAGSLALGTLLIFLVERWRADFGFRSADEISSAMNLRSLALIPDLGRRTQGMAVEDYVLQKPNSAFAEALQRVRTNLLLSPDGPPPKTVLVTSSVPLEGKSTIACTFARQSARSGLKVILIDADLRRPRLHELFGLPNQNGLSEVLTGRANPELAIRRDEKSGLDFLPAGVGVMSPPDLFRSSTMRILLEEMAAYYDLVLIDSPPVTAVSDSFTLAGLTDGTIYVVRWDTTPRNVVMAGIRQLVEAGADIAGVVLSRVDVKKHANYGYADSGYYAGSYRKYYAD